jgi:hypothetical protein
VDKLRSARLLDKKYTIQAESCDNRCHIKTQFKVTEQCNYEWRRNYCNTILQAVPDGFLVPKGTFFTDKAWVWVGVVILKTIGFQKY